MKFNFVVDLYVIASSVEKIDYLTEQKCQELKIMTFHFVRQNR